MSAQDTTPPANDAQSNHSVRGDHRVLFGWKAYDWANSAYATSTLMILQYYFGSSVVPEGGVMIRGRVFKALDLWGFANAAAAFLVFAAAPTLGAVSDLTSAKKRFLIACCYMGVVNAALLFFCQQGDVWLTLGLFVLAQVFFVGANVFYDSFLPQIAPLGKEDAVSSRGFAYGYIGGGVHFALALGLVFLSDSIGISQGMAARLGMLAAALWWGGFAVVTLFLLREPPATEHLPDTYRRYPKGTRHVLFGFARVLSTLRKVRQYRQLALYLIAFMVYSDGIQTVIKMAGAVGQAAPLNLDIHVIMITYLVVQVIAFLGALLCGRLAEIIGTRRTIMLTLVGWSIVVTFAYFMTTPLHYFLLGAGVGLVLGGSQALSRSFYASMIPEDSSAEFFGFYSVFGKFSSIWGPLIMALVNNITGSPQQAILSLIVFFVAGLILLAFVDDKEARAAAATKSLSLDGRG